MPTRNDESFFDRVYEVTKAIPPGRVTSYGAIARCIGSPQSARMVGWALNHSHAQPEFIPAHRVVNRIGMLSGKNHFRTPDMMQQLLEGEGIEVLDDKVVRFKELYWDPCLNMPFD